MNTTFQNTEICKMYFSENENSINIIVYQVILENKKLWLFNLTSAATA